MTNEKRLIDANALIAVMKEMYCDGCEHHHGVRCRACDFDCAMQDIENAPTVDAVEVVHGKWELELLPDLMVKNICSACGWWVNISPEYSPLKCNNCPNCGAKMDGDGEG